MSSTLFLIFNHRFTEGQQADARCSLGVDRIVSLPPELQELWSNLPPDASEIEPLLVPLQEWLASESVSGDRVLIQGDFGATYLMVRFAFEHGLIPIYSTTSREATEEIQPDGAVKVVHTFKHVRFRRYGG